MEKQFQLLGVQTFQPPCLGTKMTVADKLAESNLLRLGCSLTVIVGPSVVFVRKRWRQYHKTDTDRREEKTRKGTKIDHIMSACETEQRRRRFLEIYKFIFKIIFNDETALCSGIVDQLHTPGYRHDLSPFCHMRRGDIDDITVFISIMYFKSIIRKNSTSLNKRRCWKGYRLSFTQKRTEKLQKTLHTGSDHDILCRTDHIAVLSDIVSENLP